MIKSDKSYEITHKMCVMTKRKFQFYAYQGRGQANDIAQQDKSSAT